MAEKSALVFGPSGTTDNPADNKINVTLSIENGEIRLEIPAPGAVSQKEDRVNYMRGIINAAIEQLQNALA